MADEAPPPRDLLDSGYPSDIKIVWEMNRFHKVWWLADLAPERDPRFSLEDYYLGSKEATTGRYKHTAEQIIGKFREAEVLQAKGMTLEEVLRQPGISDATYYKWRKEYGGLRLDQAKEFGVANVQARILTYYLFVAIPLVLAVTLFTPELLSVLAPAQYVGAASVVFLLSCSCLMYSCYFVFGVILSHTKQTLSSLTITIPPLLVSIAMNSVLVPKLGGTGSAIASSCSYTFLAILTYYFTNRLLSVRYEWKRILIMVLAASVIVGINAVLQTQVFWFSPFIKTFLLILSVGLLALMGFFRKLKSVPCRALFGQ